MNKTMTTMILLAAATCASAATNEKEQKAPAAKALEIPKDAVLSANGAYVWTDAAGKKWQFWKTPFGVMKQPWTDPSADQPASTLTRVIDKGDTVRFERNTPFGVSAYEKKKPDLTEEEQRLYDASQTKPE